MKITVYGFVALQKFSKQLDLCGAAFFETHINLELLNVNY